MTDFQNLWDQSGEAYHNYGLAYPQYQETNRRIIEFANIHPNQTVVDLACGTGLTSKRILEAMEGKGKIYAIDFAEDMINQAKKYLKSKNIKFILSDVAKIDEIIPEKVDRIICNSSFWWFSNHLGLLKGIKKILKEDGLFIFNLPGQFYSFEDNKPTHRAKIRDMIFEEMKKRGYSHKGKSKPPLNKEKIENLIKSSGLKVVKVEFSEFEGASIKDTLDFFQIPGVTPYLEEVPDADKKKIMDMVVKRSKEIKYIPSKNRWVYFIVSKS